MPTMPPQIRHAYDAEMYDARAVGEDEKWPLLERAHVISQPYLWPHVRTHIAMLALALRQRDRREAVGQVVRIIVAAPESALGRFPSGNTGRTAAGLTTRMPIPDNLSALLVDSA